jgi:hypothetical protein
VASKKMMRGACHLQKNCAIVAVFAKKHIVCFKLINSNKQNSIKLREVGQAPSSNQKAKELSEAIEKMKKS